MCSEEVSGGVGLLRERAPIGDGVFVDPERIAVLPSCRGLELKRAAGARRRDGDLCPVGGLDTEDAPQVIRRYFPPRRDDVYHLRRSRQIALGRVYGVQRFRGASAD